MGGKHRRVDDQKPPPLTKKQKQNAQADTSRFPALQDAVDAMEASSRRMRTLRGRKDYLDRKARRES